MAHLKQEQNIICFLPFTTTQNSSEIRSRGDKLEGHNFASLVNERGMSVMM